MNKRIALVILAIVAMAAFSTTANATIVQETLNNPSFETTVVADGVNTTKLSGWRNNYSSSGTPAGTLVVRNPTSADFAGASTDGQTLPAPAAGSQALFCNNGPDYEFEVANTKQISMLANKWYVWTIAVGNPLTVPFGDWFDGFAIQLADNTAACSLISQEMHPVSEGHVNWWHTGNTGVSPEKAADDPAPGTFQSYGVVYSANDYLQTSDPSPAYDDDDNPLIASGDSIFYGFIICSQVYIDNATLYQCDSYAEAQSIEATGGCYMNEDTGQYELGVVPEPSTFVLLATGLIGLLAYAWRKRRQAV